MGGNLAESIGVRTWLRCRPPSHQQAIPAASPKDGFTRHRAAGEMLLETSFRTPTSRKEFDPEAIERLAESIRAKGLLQPIRVRWDAGSASTSSSSAKALPGGNRCRPHLRPVHLRRERAHRGRGPRRAARREPPPGRPEPIEQAQSFKRYMELLGCPGQGSGPAPQDQPEHGHQGSLAPEASGGGPGADRRRGISRPRPDSRSRSYATRRPVKRSPRRSSPRSSPRMTPRRSFGRRRESRKRAGESPETFRLEGGIKVTVAAPKKVAAEDIIRALEQATAQARAKVA